MSKQHALHGRNVRVLCEVRKAWGEPDQRIHRSSRERWGEAGQGVGHTRAHAVIRVRVVEGKGVQHHVLGFLVGDAAACCRNGFKHRGKKPVCVQGVGNSNNCSAMRCQVLLLLLASHHPGWR